MDYFLFFLYLIIICLIIDGSSFFRKTGINRWVILGLFVIRAAISVVGCYLAIHYIKNSDALRFQEFANDEYHLLFQNPKEYFTNIFPKNNLQHLGGLLEVNHSYWNDLRGNLVIKFVSILNILSNCNFYINTLIFNSLVFTASIGLYRVVNSSIKRGRIGILFFIFILPSFIYFSSALHRDGLLFILIAAVIGSFFSILNGVISLRKMVIFFLSLAGIFLLRNFVFLMMIPALFAWYFAHQKPWFAFRVFAGIYLVGIILFFSTSFLSGKKNLLQYVSERQSEFILLSEDANTTLNYHRLEPTLVGFIRNLPESIDHVFFHPRPTEWSLFYLPFIVDVLLVSLLILGVVFFRNSEIRFKPIQYFLIFFSLSMLLVIGYTIPIMGAIVRYRSIYLPLLFIGVIPLFDFEKIKRTIRIIK